MNKYLKYTLLCGLLFVCFRGNFIFAQYQTIDSLKKCISVQKNKDSLCNTFIELSWESSFYGLNSEAIDYALKAIELATQQKNEQGIINAKNALGNAYDELGEYKKAKYYFEHVMFYFKKQGSKKKLSKALNNLGTTYFNMSDYKNALTNFYDALHIKEEFKDSAGIANCYTNLGNVYWELDQKEKAAELFERSVKINRLIKNEEGAAATLANLAGLYNLKGDLSKAQQCQNEALLIYKRINLKEGIASCYTSIGLGFRQRKMNDSATYYYKKAMAISKELGDKVTYGNGLLALGQIKLEEKNAQEAIKLFIEGEQLMSEVGNFESLKAFRLALSNAYYDVGDYKNSILAHRRFTFIKDSIFNIENSKILSDLKTKFEVDKMEAELSAKAEREKENLRLIAEVDKQKRNGIIVTVALVLLVVLVFSVMLFKRFQLTQKQKKIIELQKVEVEEQKLIVEEKQKELGDSINYAKRIQSSFMATETEFKDKVIDYFILFKPKDVVSGDFYWASFLKSSDKLSEGFLYINVADSTGHGIPGAFMSLLNMSLLNEGLLSKGLRQTNELLDFVRRILILGLKQDESGQGGNDGMDCCLVCYDTSTKQLQYSGANNPLWILREDKWIELNPDKMAVGRSPKQDIPFTSQVFQCKPNDILYLFTDGFADQFGGPKGKKFKYKQLNEVILQNSSRSMEEQKHILERAFDEWKGSLEQVDDVCIIGIRL